MTDTKSPGTRSDRRAHQRQRRRVNRSLRDQGQKVRDGQGSLMLYSQFPHDPDVVTRFPKLAGANQRGSFLRRPPA